LQGQDRPPLKLAVSGRTAIIPEYMGRKARVENGFHPEIAIGQTWVRLYDPNGTLVQTNEVSLPGAESVDVIDASASRKGLTAVVAWAVNAQGARVGTIVLFDGPGPPSLVIRTGLFSPDLIAIAPDGFIWIAGMDRLTDSMGNVQIPPEQMRDLYVLQKYTPDGVLVGSFLKRSNFDAKVYPWLGTKGGATSLRASASGVGLYVAHEDASGEWVELSLAGDFKGRWAMPAPAKDLSLSTVGFTDSGSVYADWYSYTFKPDPAVGSYRLNKSTSAWERLEDPVDGVPASLHPIKPIFTGTDGDLLVFRTSHTPSQMVWFKEPPK
jgi:hypothetical protein